MRKVSVLLIAVIMFNFIFSNYSYAIDEVANQSASYSKDSFNSLADEGKVNLNGSDVKLSTSTSTAGSASGITASLFSPLFMIFSMIMTNIANSGGLYHEGTSEYGASENDYFTISSLVFGEYLLFDGKIYQTNKSLQPDKERDSIAVLMDDIKETAMGWFEILRVFALGMFLVLLIYSGARLLGATLAEDRVAWKKTILRWVVGLIFVFFVKYIIVGLNIIVDSIMDALWKARVSLENNGYKSFEVTIIKTSLANLGNYGGMKALAYGLEYSAFVIFQIIYFFKYIIRAFKLILLSVIAPIIAILHTFNQVSGKENNIIVQWLKQFLTLLFIQPLHAVMYIVFIMTASEITINAPLLGIAFLWALNRSEKIIKLMLNLNVGKLGSIFSEKKD